MLDRALAVVGGAEGIAAGAAGAGAYALAVDSRPLCARTRRLGEAAALTPRPANTPYTEAITHFARAIGAARSGNPAAASADIEQARRAASTSSKSMQDAYWTEQVDIQRRVALAWQTFAQGQKDEGIAQLRAAADAEDATDKSAISPGPIAPARELLGYMLLEGGLHKDSARRVRGDDEEGAESLPRRRTAPHARPSSLGIAPKARAYYQQLLEIAKDADTERPELMQARKAVG